MKNVPVPKDYQEVIGRHEVVTIGPPPGISREHCIDAEVCVTDEWAEDGMGLGFIVFFEPDENERKLLSEGARLKVQFRGNALVPHALGIW